MELPNEEEKKMLVQLQDALKQDMERSKSCREFPEIVSDYKLIRYIRGYEGVDGAVVKSNTVKRYGHVKHILKFMTIEKI